MLGLVIASVISLFHAQDSDTPESLRALLDQRHAWRSNGNSGSFHLQLEAKTYYADGITIENDDIIVSGVSQDETAITGLQQ